MLIQFKAIRIVIKFINQPIKTPIKMKTTESTKSKTSESGQSPRADDPLYDLSAIGDAASLAPLDAEKETADSPEEDAKQSDPAPEDPKDPKGPKELKEAPSEAKESKEESKEEQTNEAEQSQESPSLIASLLTLAADLLAGKTPENELRNLLDAAKAREEILRARAEGEIAGRNAAIEERLRPAAATTPNLCGAPAAKRRQSSIFDIAAEARSGY